jgi:lysophospholipase L1-like esterase
VLRLNASIRELAERTGTRLLDLHPLVSSRNGMRARRFARRDGSHLTDAGYRVIEAYAVPRLEAWLAAPQPAARGVPIDGVAGGHA